MSSACRLVVVTLVGASLALAGCSQGDQPPGQEATTPTAGPSESATAASSSTAAATPSPAPEAEFDASVPPPAPGELAGPPSRDAATAVAKYFMSLFPYAQATGDHTSWVALSGRDCDYCASSKRLFDELVASGAHSEGGAIEVLDAQAFDHREDQYAVLLHLTEKPSRTVSAGGDVVETYPDTLTVAADLLVAWSGETWTVESVVIDVQRRE